MQLDDFFFTLPQELIARYPLEKRSESRLLCLPQTRGSLIHRQFDAIAQLANEGDLLIFNDTKVIPARLYGQKITGGRVEILVERVLDDQRILGQLRASKSPHPGDNIFLKNNVSLKVLGRQGFFYELIYESGDGTVMQLIEDIGEIPLPLYMQRPAEAEDHERYQTIYAKHKGSVAAPTAGLHFDADIMQALHAKKVEMAYLTLHIGAGTFAPIRVDNIHDHKMHGEYFEVSADICAKIQATKARGNRVIAIGTTSLRALEAASQNGVTEPFNGETNIFIYPGYAFRCADILITNLHLPRSTLLMLVCAFGGYERIIHAYHEAVAQSYRFYSYGDAMWIERR